MKSAQFIHTYTYLHFVENIFPWLHGLSIRILWVEQTSVKCQRNCGTYVCQYGFGKGIAAWDGGCCCWNNAFHIQQFSSHCYRSTFYSFMTPPGTHWYWTPTQQRWKLVAKVLKDQSLALLASCCWLPSHLSWALCLLFAPSNFQFSCLSFFFSP